jgi:hypothetical protein
MKKYNVGGLLKGLSHEEGGIPILAEGGEVIVNDAINNAASKHEEELLALNENPDDYMIVPVSDARGRSQVVREGGKVKNKGVK